MLETNVDLANFYQPGSMSDCEKFLPSKKEIKKRRKEKEEKNYHWSYTTLEYYKTKIIELFKTHDLKY